MPFEMSSSNMFFSYYFLMFVYRVKVKISVLVREVAKKVLFLVARPLRGGGVRGVPPYGKIE